MLFVKDKFLNSKKQCTFIQEIFSKLQNFVTYIEGRNINVDFKNYIYRGFNKCKEKRRIFDIGFNGTTKR